MAKFSNNNLLNKQEKEKLLVELCQALTLVKDIKEASQLLADLLSGQELNMVAKRLKVAKLLLKGLTYQQIREQLGVSEHTIARINSWLYQAGSGYRLINKRSKNKKINLDGIDNDNIKLKNMSEPFTWGSIKRRYPLYFWPELLLEEIIKIAGNKRKNKLRQVLKNLKNSEIKNDLYQKLSRILR